MILDPVRPGHKRALSAEAREGLTRIVTLLLSDEADTRAKSVTVLSQHCTAEIRTDVLSELIDATKGDGARREAAMRALQAIGSPAVELLKWFLYQEQRPKQRLHLVELLGTVARRWDLLVILVLRECVAREDEHRDVKAAAREGLARIAPEDPAEWPENQATC